MPTNDLTAGEVAARLGIKRGMVRRYALALEEVTGISLEPDPVRGRLYPLAAVELLEAARAHLLAHPGLSVEAALRGVTGQSEGAVTPPARVPGTVTPADLQAALSGALAQLNAPVLAALAAQQEQSAALAEEVTALRSEVASLNRELQAARSTVERVEVITRAALPSTKLEPVAVGWLGWLLRLLRG